MQDEPARRKRSNGIKQGVYDRLNSGVSIVPEDLAGELGCSTTAVAHNIRNWEREGNRLNRRRNEQGYFVYIPAGTAEHALVPSASKGYLQIPQIPMPQFGQMLQVTGIGAFDSHRISVILRDDSGNTWAADLSARKE